MSDTRKIICHAVALAELKFYELKSCGVEGLEDALDGLYKLREGAVLLGVPAHEIEDEIKKISNYNS